MITVMWLLFAQGVLGAFDTLYYHEYRTRLVAQAFAHTELLLHAVRDFIYAAIFVTLPFWQWRGALAYVLFVLIACEVGITLADFVVEDRTRKLPGGERISHTLMALIYGAVLAYWLPEVWDWRRGDTDFETFSLRVPELLRYAFPLMAAGVFASGVRDLLAVVRGVRWPW